MKRFLKVSLMLISASVLLSSCNCYKKMVKNADEVTFSCTPTVLSLKGNTVSADVTVTFPAGYFNKKALLKVTPVLVFEDGEITGTPKYVQGEKVKDNYTVIAKETGGSYVQNVTFPYDSRADICTMELRIEGKCTSGKYGVFTPIIAVEVAQGISTVQKLADNSDGLALMPDNFKRVTTISQDAEIMYLINRANVREGELTKDQIKLFEDFVKEYSDKDRATMGNIYAKGYASPDGPLDFNDKLAKERSQTGQKAISEQLKGVDAKYDIAAYGEDWEGFKELVAASDIKDKDLILQVLAMYDNPVKRDEEIRNMSSVFDVLAEEILPQLRRTKLSADVDIEGRTDDEILAAISEDIDALSEEELLYGATLTDDPALKIEAYKTAATKFNSARGYNNLGVVLGQCGETDDAKSAIEKAATLSNDPIISNNLGVLALMNGDVDTAKSYLSALNTPEASKSMALVDLAEGDYAEAARSLDGYNLAVAEVLNGNLEKAKSVLSGDDSAQADYLNAIIAMREGDSASAITNLESAISKDSTYKDKAANDIEFAKLFGSDEFLAL